MKPAGIVRGADSPAAATVDGEKGEKLYELQNIV